jgi:polysaccharide export outer membrane protein
MQNRHRPLFYIVSNALKLNGNLERQSNALPVSRNKRSFKQLLLVAGFFVLVAGTSCTATKNQVYFNNLQKDTTLRNLVSKNYDLKIQKSDMLGITVASLSPDIAFYNAPQNTVGPLSGYQVDENGNISFIKLGTLHVEGLTRKQLKDTLQTGLVPYLKDVIVSVAFLNRHVTMIGATGSSVLPIVADNMTLLDALASSGDIGQRGKMNNVLIIREKDNNKVFKRINLEDQSIFYSPYYYLQPNDIVYVEPLKVRTPLTIPVVISYITTAISLLILVLRL